MAEYKLAPEVCGLLTSMFEETIDADGILSVEYQRLQEEIIPYIARSLRAMELSGLVIPTVRTKILMERYFSKIKEENK